MIWTTYTDQRKYLNYGKFVYTYLLCFIIKYPDQHCNETLFRRCYIGEQSENIYRNSKIFAANIYLVKC